jgi:sec-independent protein translocase protein TatA
MPALGPWELFIVLMIVVVIFGAGRLSEIGGALGKGIREFRSATKDEAKEEAPTVTTKTTVVEAPADVRCPSCGTVNPPGQTFCGQCGSRLGKAA